MRSWATRSTNCHGPTHTGAVPNFSPSFLSAAGEIGMPARSASCAVSGENGAFSRSRTVRGSTTSTAVTDSSSLRRLEPFISRCRSSENFMASALNGVPSLNFTPGAELDGDGLARIAHRRQRGGELRMDVQALVDVVELLAHLGKDDPSHVGAGQRRIEDVGILVERHHQLLLGPARRRTPSSAPPWRGRGRRSADAAHRRLQRGRSGDGQYRPRPPERSNVLAGR